MKKMEEIAERYLTDLHSAMTKIPKGAIAAVSDSIVEAFEQGKQIFVAGNGGSAASASHMACDFAKTTLGKSHEKISKRMKAIALSDNVPLLTAWGNDVGYEVVFAEQLRNLANAGDLLIVITASGNSPNIIECLNASRELGLKSIGLLGFQGGKARELCDIAIVVESSDYGVIEDGHMILNHMFTEFLKQHVQK